MVDQAWQPDDELQFNFRPKLRADESLAGYLLDFASENVLAGLRGLARYAAVPPWGLFEIERDRLARLLWGSQGERRADYLLLKDAESPRRYGARALRRVCPLCLTEGNTRYARSAWDQPMSTHCKRHRVLLRNSCKSCGEPLDYMVDQDVATCRCGASLADQSADSLPRWVPYIHLALDPTMCTARHADMSAEATAALVLQQICRLGRSRESTADVSTDALALPFATEAAILKAEPWFENWPIGFSAALVRRGYGRGRALPLEIAVLLGQGKFPDIDDAIEHHERSRAIVIVGAGSKEKGRRGADESGRTESGDEMIVHYPLAFFPTPFGGLSSYTGARGAVAVQVPEATAEDSLKIPNESGVRALTGMLPHLVLMWLTTRAVERSGDWTWPSLANFVRRMGFSAHGGSGKSPAARIRATLEKMLAGDYSSLAVSGTYLGQVPGEEGRLGQLLEAPQHRYHLNLVAVSAWFEQVVCARTVSFKSSEFRALSGSRTAQLLYLYGEARLEGRYHGHATVAQVANQIGLRYSNERRLRQAICAGLENLRVSCPTLKFSFDRGQILVQRTTASGSSTTENANALPRT